MTIELNGEPREVRDGATVAAALGLLDLPPDARGVAVAVDAEVVPRRQWPSRALVAGARVEVLTAMQGG
jgi:sulfur carrier protein